MKVEKWGDSLAVRLPVALVEALQLKEGDDIEIRFAGEREFGAARKPDPQDLLSQLRAYRGRLPRDFKFDREEANGRLLLRQKSVGQRGTIRLDRGQALDRRVG
jgi:antitoxin MazE